MPRISRILDRITLHTSFKSHQNEFPLMETRKLTIIVSQIAEQLLQLSSLPDEIIIEIMLRLPVKSLLKFRCVSKSWLLLLSSPHFINTQIKFSVQECKNVNFRLVVVASGSGLCKICSIYSLNNNNVFSDIPQVGSGEDEMEKLFPIDPQVGSGEDEVERLFQIDPRLKKDSSLNVVKMDYPLKAPPGSGKFIGSCNGLVCLTAVSSKMMLWNPSTGKYKEFQDSFVRNVGGCYIRYGFGYDVSNDDYKVVKMFSFRKDDGKYENIVKIYSLRANSWTMVQGFNSGYINAQLGVFVNGVLHWDVCHNRESTPSWEIMTLDLVTEKYGMMVLPSCRNGDFGWTLSALGGQLVACCYYYPDRTDMWVMKEYGVENSWTKLVSITSPSDRRGYISPLFVSKNGDEVLVKLGTVISLYNSRNNSYKSLNIDGSGGCHQVQAVTYIETLASPDIGDK